MNIVYIYFKIKYIKIEVLIINKYFKYYKLG